MHMHHQPIHLPNLAKPRYTMCPQFPNEQPSMRNPNAPNTIHLIKFTYRHKRFPNIAIKDKSNKHNPLIQTLKIVEWNVSPLLPSRRDYMTLTTNNHQKRQKTSKHLKAKQKLLTKHVHQTAMKYLTHLIRNKRKLDNKEKPVANTPLTQRLGRT